MQSIFEKASYDGDVKTLETLKNNNVFSYDRIICDASYDGNYVYVFEWLKKSGYIFKQEDLHVIVSNAVSIGQYHSLQTLEWVKNNNNYDVKNIILQNYDEEDLNDIVLEWIQQNYISSK